jgi:nucleoside-diphosphate-sugar epimerase
LQNSKIKKIGITGSTGILGRKLIIKLKNVNLIIFKGDISIKQNVYNWVNGNNFDAVIHLAAVVSITKVNKNKNKAIKVNYFGTKYLIDALIINQKKNNKKTWFFFASSSHVYSYSKNKKKEESKVKPLNYYGSLKDKTEKYLLKKSSLINICIGRIFSFTDVKQNKSFFLPSIYHKIKEGEAVSYYKLYKEIRDFISVDDIIRALIMLMRINYRGVINICNGKEVNLFNIYETISKYLGKKVIKKRSYKNFNILVGDNSKLKKIGFKAKHNIKDIITNYHNNITV